MNKNITIIDSLESMMRVKRMALGMIDQITDLNKRLDNLLHTYNGYSPARIEWRFDNYEKNREEKCIDRIMWRYVVGHFQLQKYMLCTEYEKMQEEIDQFKTPQFTTENAKAWLSGLKELIHQNIRTMLKSVYDKIITGHYYTGSGYSSQVKKKRNNNGIDRMFILRTSDYSHMFGYGYYRYRPTITDDFEKACYILDGKILPEKPMKEIMSHDKKLEAENPYFKIRICKNGNTHYTVFDTTREKLNRIGPDGNIIGEPIRIKIFEEKW